MIYSTSIKIDYNNHFEKKEGLAYVYVPCVAHIFGLECHLLTVSTKHTGMTSLRHEVSDFGAKSQVFSLCI